MNTIDLLYRNRMKLELMSDGKGHYRLIAMDGQRPVFDQTFPNVDVMRAVWRQVADNNDMIDAPL